MYWIDTQTDKDTGITIGFNNCIMNSTHCYTDNMKNNTFKRKALKLKFFEVFDLADKKARELNAEVIVVIERIRLQSQGFLIINYIFSNLIFINKIESSKALIINNNTNNCCKCCFK